MTHKQALVRILEMAQRTFGDDHDTVTAMRAFFVVVWLDDMNWHSEAEAIAKRALAMPPLAKAFRRLEQDEPRVLYDLVSTFNDLFGWAIQPDEWRAPRGAKLVKELWEVITTLPAKERLGDIVITHMKLPNL
jgi:hypothetical protein